MKYIIKIHYKCKSKIKAPIILINILIKKLCFIDEDFMILTRTYQIINEVKMIKIVYINTIIHDKFH